MSMSSCFLMRTQSRSHPGQRSWANNFWSHFLEKKMCLSESHSLPQNTKAFLVLLWMRTMEAIFFMWLSLEASTSITLTDASSGLLIISLVSGCFSHRGDELSSFLSWPAVFWVYPGTGWALSGSLGYLLLQSLPSGNLHLTTVYGSDKVPEGEVEILVCCLWNSE